VTLKKIAQTVQDYQQLNPSNPLHVMGNSSERLNFDQGKKNEIQHHS
jgi:hypothetical protein